MDSNAYVIPAKAGIYYNTSIAFTFLPKTSIWKALSPLGQSLETPKGIFYWSSRSRKEAEIDGTIGIAQDDDGTIAHLKIAEEWVGSRVLERLPKAKVFGYAPIEGLESLRKKWLTHILDDHPSLKNFITLPVVTNGITHALAITGRLFLEPGQTLITADKSWENYEHIFTDLQGAKMFTFPLFTNGALHIDAIIGAAREVASRQGKAVILLNFPHNQTGFMPSINDAQELGRRFSDLCKSMPAASFVLLLDDAYEGYVYDEKGLKRSFISEVFAPLSNLTVAKLDGISKVMLAYGYRIGFLTFALNSLDGSQFDETFLHGMHEEMGSKIGGAIRGEISQVNHHGQIFADALLDDFSEVMKQRFEVIQRLKERFSILMQALTEAYKKYGEEKIYADPCNGGFFCYLNLQKGIDPRTICERLLKDKKVGLVPSAQGLRVAFCGVQKDKIPTMIRSIFEVVYTN